MSQIPIDPTVDWLQMVLGTIVALMREELGRPYPNFENPNDSVAAILLNMAMYGKTAEHMRQWLQQQPEWIEKHQTPKIPDIGTGVSSAIVGGRWRSSGPRLVNDNGFLHWKLVTAFDAPRLAVQNRWDVLKAYAAWTRSVGGNGWRGFMNWKVTGFDFRNVPEYLAAQHRLLEFTRDEGLMFLGTAICDQIPEGLNTQQDFMDSIFGLFNEFDHTIGECANEPYNGNSEFPSLFNRSSSWGNLLVARGMCRPDADPSLPDPHNRPYTPSLGFTTYQNGRSADWYRKAGKDGMEIRATTHDACINNETMGAAESMQPGRRSNRVVEFKAAGGGAGLFTSGITGHGDSETMQKCRVPGPIETSCIKAMFDALDMIPIDAPLWTYTRYGPGHPSEPMPVAMDPNDNPDETNSRVHAMVGPGVAAVVNYNAAIAGREGWVAQPANGWRITKQDGPIVLCER